MTFARPRASEEVAAMDDKLALFTLDRSPISSV